MNSSLCNYCTENQIQDFLLSLHLTGTLTHSPKAELALLYGLANHAEDIAKECFSRKRTAANEYFMYRIVC